MFSSFYFLFSSFFPTFLDIFHFLILFTFELFSTDWFFFFSFHLISFTFWFIFYILHLTLYFLRFKFLLFNFFLFILFYFLLLYFTFYFLLFQFTLYFLITFYFLFYFFFSNFFTFCIFLFCILLNLWIFFYFFISFFYISVFSLISFHWKIWVFDGVSRKIKSNWTDREITLESQRAIRAKTFRFIRPPFVRIFLNRLRKLHDCIRRKFKEVITRSVKLTIDSLL